MQFEKREYFDNHTITSNNILCCADTGRVVAVFYNDYDLDNLLEQVESKASKDVRDFFNELEQRPRKTK